MPTMGNAPDGKAPEGVLNSAGVATSDGRGSVAKCVGGGDFLLSSSDGVFLLGHGAYPHTNDALKNPWTLRVKKRPLLKS